MTNPYPPQALSNGQAPWPQSVSPPSAPSWAQPQGPETAQPENFYQSVPEDKLWAEFQRKHPTILDGLEWQYRVDQHVVDFALPAHKVVFEVDGYVAHKSNDAWAKDRRRDLALSLNGWRVYRIDANSVLTDPEGVINQFARIVTILDIQQADLRMAKALDRIAAVLERIEAHIIPFSAITRGEDASV